MNTSPLSLLPGFSATLVTSPQQIRSRTALDHHIDNFDDIGMIQGLENFDFSDCRYRYLAVSCFKHMGEGTYTITRIMCDELL